MLGLLIDRRVLKARKTPRLSKQPRRARGCWVGWAPSAIEGAAHELSPHDPWREFCLASNLALLQIIEQRLRRFEISRLEALDEPIVDWREQFARLLTPVLLAPHPREAGGGA